MEFVQIMKDWRRMCKAQNDTICGECSSCPMGDDGKSCMAVYENEFDAVDFAHIEQTVMSWAAEHTEPVYPTWGEYLCNIGLIHDCTESEDAIYRLFNNIIPADIAQKLGIEPKEG